MTALRFGLQLTAVHDGTGPPEAQLREHEELTSLAVQMGFDFVSVGQHFLSEELRYLQPIPYLLHLAHHAPGLRVATGILLLPMLNPVQVAEDVATLDILTGGRAILGVGLGYSDREFAVFGTSRRERTGRMAESVQVIRALWSGEPTAFEGRHYAFDRLVTATRPVQSGGPPIWMGGQTAPAVRRAARLADAWWTAPFPTHEELRTLTRIYVEEREKEGLPLPATFPVRRDMVIAADRQEALRLASAWAGSRFDTYMRWGLGRDLEAEGGLDSSTDATVADRFILGSPEECADQIRVLASDVGMTHLVLKPQWVGQEPLDAHRQLERFAGDVLPLLAGEGG